MCFKWQKYILPNSPMLASSKVSLRTVYMCVLHRIVVAMHVYNLLKVVKQLRTCIHASLIDFIFIGKSNKKNEYSDLTGLVNTSVYTYIYISIPSTSTIH